MNLKLTGKEISILKDDGKQKYTQVIDDPLTNLDSKKINSMLKIIADLSKESPIVMIAVDNELISNYKKLNITKFIDAEKIIN